jgi:four helix bundle protein
MMPYEKLEAWKLSHQMALEMYRVSGQWPRSERYELTTQLRRAALSVPTNMAEGVAKRGNRELRRYLDICLGSLSELSYLLLFARDRGLLQQADWEELDSLRNRVGQLTWRLAQSLSGSKSPANS